jgi:hypothetical protein
MTSIAQLIAPDADIARMTRDQLARRESALALSISLALMIDADTPACAYAEHFDALDATTDRLDAIAMR